MELNYEDKKIIDFQPLIEYLFHVISLLGMLLWVYKVTGAFVHTKRLLLRKYCATILHLFSQEQFDNPLIEVQSLHDM